MACGDYPPFGLVPIPASGVSLELQGLVQRAERDVLRITGISASYLGQDALIAELQAEVARMKTAHAAAYAVDFQRCQEIARLRTEVESLRVEKRYLEDRIVTAAETIRKLAAGEPAMWSDGEGLHVRGVYQEIPEEPVPAIFNAIKAHR